MSSGGLFNAQVRVVEPDGRPTRELVRILGQLVSTTDTGLAGRVSSLESAVTLLGTRMSTAEGNITSLQASVSTQAQQIADLQVADVWV